MIAISRIGKFKPNCPTIKGRPCSLRVTYCLALDSVKSPTNPIILLCPFYTFRGQLARVVRLKLRISVVVNELFCECYGLSDVDGPRRLLLVLIRDVVGLGC